MTGRDKEPGVEVATLHLQAQRQKRSLKSHSSCWPASARTGRPARTQAQPRALGRAHLISAAAGRI